MSKNVSKAVSLSVIVMAVLALVLAMRVGFGDEKDQGGTPAAAAVADEGVQPVVSDARAAESSEQDARDNEADVPDQEDDSYETLKDQLLDELAEHRAPTGDNARDAAQEQGILTVAELSEQLADRGFPPLEITANFDLAGTYLEGAVLDPSSEERYPSYQMFYQSHQGVVWAIAVNAHAYFAVPVAAEGVSLQRQIILSESDTVIQYDGARRQYSDFTFDELGDALGIQVAKVDRATLESYTAQQLEDM